MTPHIFDLVRSLEFRGAVLEFGSYIEANQEHLDMRRAFPAGVKYVGADVVEGPGVDRACDLRDETASVLLANEVGPTVVLCLYTLEHTWEIHKAAASLGAIRRRHPESWLLVGTHQNQPYHGTAKYGDYWRVTGLGMRKLMDGAGIEGGRVLVHADTSNPEDVLFIRQPESQAWPSEVFERIMAASPVHWEYFP